MTVATAVCFLRRSLPLKSLADFLPCLLTLLQISAIANVLFPNCNNPNPGHIYYNLNKSQIFEVDLKIYIYSSTQYGGGAPESQQAMVR